MCFIPVLWRPQYIGGVAEWFKAAVLKTADCNRSQSSNLCASAISRYLKAPESGALSFLAQGFWRRRIPQALRNLPVHRGFMADKTIDSISDWVAACLCSSGVFHEL